MKPNKNIDEILEDWQGQRRATFDEIDISSAVMVSIQPLVTMTQTTGFESSAWLEVPSMFAGLIRASIALFAILTPV